MPPLPPAAQCLKVRLVGTKTSLTWNNVLHVRYAGPAPTATDLVTFGTAVGTLWNTAIAPICPADVTLTEVDVVDLTSATSAAGTASVTHAGTRVGSGLGGQVAVVTSWLQSLRYRGGHPRTYWPGGTGADLQDGGHWTGAAVTQFKAASEAFRVGMNALTVGTASVQLINLSYRTLNAPRPTPLPVIITGSDVHPRIDTQRRRLGKEA